MSYARFVILAIRVRFTPCLINFTATVVPREYKTESSGELGTQEQTSSFYVPFL